MMHECLLTSAKNRHWAVLASSIGLLLLQLAVRYFVVSYAPKLIKLQTVFSTGLLVLEPTKITQSNVPFFVRTGFNGSGFDLSAIGSNAAQQVYGIQSGKLSYPSSTSENLAVQHFDPPSGFSVSTYSAEVKGFSTNLDCEILHLGNATRTYLPYFSIQAPYFIVNITSGSCHIQNAIVGEGADHGYYYNDNVNENYQGRFQNFTCNTGGSNSIRYPLSGNSSSDHRFLLSMALLQWAPHLPAFESSSTWVKNLTAVLCKPSYSIDNYSVSYTQAQNNQRMQANKKSGTNETLKGFDNSMLIRAVQASFNNISFGQGGEDYVVTEVPSFFQVMKAMHNVSTLKPFMDPSLLQDLGSRIFQDASANIASKNLMVPQYDSASGSLTYMEDRLQVERLTVGLMATCLGLLVCISILEVLVRPWNTVSREPNSIGALSTMLAASRSLRQCLASTGSATLVDLQRRLSRDKFQTVIVQQQTNSFVLEPVSNFANVATSPPSSSVCAKVEWWRPTAVRSWFTALIVVLPLLFIVLLEVLQHISDSRNGIVEVSNSKIDSQILSTYLPAFVTLILAILYTSLDSAISIFAPLAALRRGNVPATRSIMVSSVGRLPPFALFQSLRSRHFAQSLTIIAAFVSTLLAIVVSALYTVETISNDQTLLLQQADFFDWTHVDLSQDDGFAGSVTNLILYENTSYPQWTYNNLVLPSLTASSAKTSTPSDRDKSIVVKIPAIRGSLSNCSAVPPKLINITAEGAPLSCANCNDLVGLNFIMGLPYSLCGFDSKKPNTATWSQGYAAPNDSSVVYAGKGTALRWTSGSSIVGDGGIILDHQRSSVKTFSTLDNSIPSCPSVSYSLGMAHAGTKTKNSSGSDGVPWSSKQNITVVYCYQRLEQVMANVTFSYPDFTINSTVPPIPLEETAIAITQNKSQHWFYISINTLINSLQKPSVSNTVRNDIDGFIQALSWGRNGVPLDQLYNNGDISTLNAAANRLYGQYIAQVISAKMRTSVPPNNTNSIYNIIQKPSNYTATLYQPKKRLHQNRGPKIALQAMLAFLVVCAMATYFLMDTKRVVPHNPCSIAGVMSLMAESKMCRTRQMIPEGSEWETEQKRRSEGLFGGQVFRMGWWGINGDILGDEVEDKRLFAIDVAESGELEGK